MILLNRMAQEGEVGKTLSFVAGFSSKFIGIFLLSLASEVLLHEQSPINTLKVS